MTRGATLFSGGGGVEARLKERIDFVHAVEYDPAIASVYRQNHGDHIQVTDVCSVDYSAWGQLDYLHVSPVCKNASQAKTGGAESDTDIQTALAVVRCLEATQPRVFTLENVWGYRQFEAFRRICAALDRGGYMWHFEHLNAADFGVPQTRRRLILRAVRDALLPGWPAPEPWVGWYAAIEDLLPGLPESKFAAWQLARLPEAITGDILMMSNVSGYERAEIGQGICDRMRPAHTVAAEPTGGMPRAFLMRSSNTQQEWGDGVPHAVAPAYTVATDSPPKAFLMPSVNGDGTAHPRNQDEPAHTCVSTVAKNIPRAWLSQGRVVKMTPRALARFQSLPDTYILPDKSSLACTIIGNMVPSLLMKKVVEPLL